MIVGRIFIVVGGQMSGVEVAAQLALQLSSDANSPGTADQKTKERFTITHIIQRPFWVMPWFFPTNPHIDKSPEEKVCTKHGRLAVRRIIANGDFRHQIRPRVSSLWISSSTISKADLRDLSQIHQVS